MRSGRADESLSGLFYHIKSERERNASSFVPSWFGYTKRAATLEGRQSAASQISCWTSRFPSQLVDYSCLQPSSAVRDKATMPQTFLPGIRSLYCEL
jgi:hypothetical protein